MAGISGVEDERCCCCGVVTVTGICGSVGTAGYVSVSTQVPGSCSGSGTGGSSPAGGCS